ncbi:MAG: C25 family cysteine peptidase, partial [Anaerolineae bacterium]|nr:C25 family cysteine peptidase [Anaerolineae bacterium]
MSMLQASIVESRLAARRSAALLFVAGVLCLLALGACRSAAGTPTSSNAPAVKIAVSADGIYEAPASDLRAAGFDLAKADARTLSLTTGGRAIPFEVLGEGDQRVLRFYGQALGPKAQTAQNIYWLSKQPSGAGQAAGPITIRSAAPPSGMKPSTVVSATVHAEEQRQWVAKAGPGDDRWMWQTIFAPVEAKFTISVPYPAGGDGELRVRAWGNSSAPADPDHHWLLSLNGTQVADVRWDGLAGHAITATIPAGVLRAGDNQLSIRAPGDTGAPADSVFLDWAEISYDRELVADSPELVFQGTAPGYTGRVKEAPAALWDITDPARPVALKDYKVEKGVIHFSAPADGASRRFALATKAGLRRPAAITAAPEPGSPAAERPRNWPGGADLIVITVPQFRDALAPLIKAREAQGLRVAVMDVSEVYDAFSHGRTDPAAIRALVQQAIGQWTAPAPRYLLLAGDASYDPRSYLKAGDKGAESDLVPTELVDTDVTGWTASDVWFALPPGTVLDPYGRPGARPALAIGRLPAQTAEQMAAMVAKILAHEQGDAAAPWRRQAFFAADNDESGFAEQVDALTKLLSGYDAQVVTVDKDGAARASLLKAFADGTGLISYFGHGSLNLWAQEKI